MSTPVFGHVPTSLWAILHSGLIPKLSFQVLAVPCMSLSQIRGKATIFPKGT